MSRITIALAVGTLFIGSSSAASQLSGSLQATANCSDLQLYAAQGVPHGAVHKYRFRGICRGLQREAWVEVESRYDASTATLDEAVKVTISGQSSGQSGTIHMRLRCTKDPLLPLQGASAMYNALAKARCTLMTSQASAPWPDFVLAWKKGKPYTAGKVTYENAVALSKQVASSVPPPPPPAAHEKKPLLKDVKNAIAALDSAKTTQPGGRVAGASVSGKASTAACGPAAAELSFRSHSARSASVG